MERYTYTLHVVQCLYVMSLIYYRVMPLMLTIESLKTVEKYVLQLLWHLGLVRITKVVVENENIMPMPSMIDALHYSFSCYYVVFFQPIFI